MARPEITGRRIGKRRPRVDPEVLVSLRDPDLPVDCYSVREFCRSHRLSERYYRELRALGLGPDELRLGHKILISRESAQRWREERTAASKAEATQEANRHPP
jgi:hypothetical protein